MAVLLCGGRALIDLDAVHGTTRIDERAAAGVIRIPGSPRGPGVGHPPAGPGVAVDNPRVTPRTSAAASGLVVVAKPAGLTSHDVVARLRRALRTRRIGHAGTLDPMATGVLVCGVNRGTRLLGHLALDSKAYTATVRLGATTTTDDAEGEPVTGPASGTDATGVPDAAIVAGMAALTGAIEQVPSSVSAIKVAGKRAYALVRAGEQVVLAARPVTVSEFTLLARRDQAPYVDLDVHVECSSGTYVRALARDLGAGLGVGGHLTALHRTRVGPFTLEHARTLEDLQADPGLSLTLDQAVAVAFARRDVDTALAVDLSHGRPLPPAGLPGTYGVFAPDDHAVALVTERDGLARPVVVLAPA
jgi:tRNA pseudouridine55 synthase